MSLRMGNDKISTIMIYENPAPYHAHLLEKKETSMRRTKDSVLLLNSEPGNRQLLSKRARPKYNSLS